MPQLTKRNYEALLVELKDHELAKLIMVATEEWNRRRAMTEDTTADGEGQEAADIKTPPQETVEELHLIRDDLIAGKAIIQHRRQIVRSVALQFPEWVESIGLPSTVTTSDWVYARIMLSSRE